MRPTGRVISTTREGGTVSFICTSSEALRRKRFFLPGGSVPFFLGGGSCGFFFFFLTSLLRGVSGLVRACGVGKAQGLNNPAE